MGEEGRPCSASGVHFPHRNNAMASVLILSRSCICAKWAPTSGPETLTQLRHIVSLRKMHFQFQTTKLEVNSGEHILVIQGLSVPSRSEMPTADKDGVCQT